MVRFYIPSSFGLDLRGAWRRSTCHKNHNSWHGPERPGTQKKDIGKDEEFVIAKTDFLLAVCRGFLDNFPADLMHTFVREVCKWAGESLPDSNNPLNLQLSDAQLVRYEDGIGGTYVTFEAVKQSFVLPPLVQTGCVLQNMDFFKTLLVDEQPIIVSGPEGCGKNLLIRHSISRLHDELDRTFNVAVLHCNTQKSSKDVLQMLRQFCSITTGTSGRIYRPKEERQWVFYMKDINLPSPDKYDTSNIVMFLSQVVMHNGFYDDGLEFVQLGHIQIVSSMAPASTFGHHPLATRLAANLRVCAISYPTMEELIEVYSQMVGAGLTNPKYQNMADKAHSLICKAVEAMVDVYINTRSKFTVDDHDHYLFNPRDLTLWVLQLRYDFVSVDTFLDAWAYEANRSFGGCRVTGPV